MAQNVFLLFLKYITVDLIGDFFYFPVWWYSKGFKKSISFSIEKIKNIEKSLGIGIWLKNLFKPMYAQYDWQGRMISFLMRLFQLFARLIVFGVFFIIILFLPLIWLVLPIFVVFQIILILKI
ncbi:MAG: hypothetical protein GWO87_03020 [Xanthomonadaceae bacterium]|nr:hypothetical protein [Rhodospirillaceae bacterium]NIA18134.1 hypothetical protein [Xanthomonadaceae bacterium]